MNERDDLQRLIQALDQKAAFVLAGIAILATPLFSDSSASGAFDPLDCRVLDWITIVSWFSAATLACCAIFPRFAGACKGIPKHKDAFRVRRTSVPIWSPLISGGEVMSQSEGQGSSSEDELDGLAIVAKIKWNCTAAAIVLLFLAAAGLTFGGAR